MVILADVQRSALNAETALTTLSTTLTSLPVSILSTPDCVDTITAVWAKTKEFVRSQMREASSPPVGVTLPELLGRTIVEGAKRLPDSVKILYLEGELKAGKTWWVVYCIFVYVRSVHIILKDLCGVLASIIPCPESHFSQLLSTALEPRWAGRSCRV